jgi:protein ImuA
MSVPNPKLDALKQSLFATQFAKGPVMPFGDGRIDGCFPAGGLPLERWHEITGFGMEAETGAAPAAFAARMAAAALARTWAGGWVVWIARNDDLYAPGLEQSGLDARRLMLVSASTDAELLAAMEDALRTRGVAAVVAEPERLDLVAGRRLQLACEQGRATGFVVRRRFAVRAGRQSPGQGQGQVSSETSAAATRWRVEPAPSLEAYPAMRGAGPAGLGAPRWRVRLERCRGGRSGDWILEGAEEDWSKTDGAHPVRLVAELGGHDLDAANAPRRAAG